jgi:hypothetical protein
MGILSPFDVFELAFNVLQFVQRSPQHIRKFVAVNLADQMPHAHEYVPQAHDYE